MYVCRAYPNEITASNRALSLNIKVVVADTDCHNQSMYVIKFRNALQIQMCVCMLQFYKITVFIVETVHCGSEANDLRLFIFSLASQPQSYIQMHIST